MLVAALGLTLVPIPQEELLIGLSPADPPLPLAYAQGGSGLEQPRLEGGDTEFEVGDVNGDGHLDVLSIGDHGSPFINTLEHGVMTWLGDGRGGFTLSQAGEFGYGGIAIGDVNNDGFADVAYGMHHNYSATDFGDQLLEVALGDGSGVAWTPWDDGLATNGETWGMFATDLADVDGDGDLDVGSNSFGCCAGVHVYLNQGDGSWVQSFGFLGGNANPELEFGDLNRDGHADFVVGNSIGNVWIGDGLGGFANVETGLAGSASSRGGLDVGDVNLDGQDDFLFVRAAGNVSVWTLGAGAAWQQLSTGLPESSAVRLARIADMDGDGSPDVVGFGGGQVGVWRGDGSGGFRLTHAFALPTSGTPEVLRVRGDVDHNGRPDVLVMQDESCGLFCSRNALYLFQEVSTPRALGARLVGPRGGEVWRQGSVRHVDWLAAVPAGVAARVRIELSVSGPEGPWTALAVGRPCDGRAQVIVPSVTTSDARVRVQVSAGFERALVQSERAFSIQP